MGKYSGTKREQQEDFSAYNGELKAQLDRGTPLPWADAWAWKAQRKAVSDASAPDESRLQGGLTIKTASDRQRRGGQYADLDTTYRALAQVKALHDVASTPSQRAMIEAALDTLPGKPQVHAKTRANRMMMLRSWRKVLGLVISDVGADKYSFLASQYAEALMKIETELAYLGNTMRGTMHFENVASMLPLHVQRVGRDAIVERFRQLMIRYSDEYRDAAIASIETGAFKLPSLIDGREIGKRFNLTAARLKQLFPKGTQYGIRACDRDEINADLEARGLKVRKPRKPKTRQEIARAAAEQREIEELMAHFDVKRETVLKWHNSKPKPGSDVWGERYYDMLERMEDEKAAGIDPKTQEEQLNPELKRELCKFHDVWPDTIRQWKRRGKLPEKVAEYRRATGLTIVI